MNPLGRLDVLRNFFEGLQEQRDAATAKGEPFLLDGESTIALLGAILDGRDDFEPDFQGFNERAAKLQEAPRFTLCVAMTGWSTTPAVSKSAP